VDVRKYDALILDIEWVAAEWNPSDTSIWVQMEKAQIESGPEGSEGVATEKVAIDAVNTGYPGSWDPGTWGDHARTLKWDFSSHVPAEGDTWMKIRLSTNMGGSIVTVGNYYIDNVRLVYSIPTPRGIIYVDATDGDTGNTTLATGEVWTATGGNDGTDGLWRPRAFANSGTIFEANGANNGGANDEDVPRLKTSASVPEDEYDVYVYFWDDGSGWRVRASLENIEGDMPLYVAGDPNTTAANAADFESCVPVMVTEDGRTLYQAYLGTTGTTTMIDVYIDSDPRPAGDTSWDERTWYDGIGYIAVED
jgi:hypothetical protein